MNSEDLTTLALELPVKERAELANRLLESLSLVEHRSPTMEEGVRRIEDIMAGRIAGLTLEEYRKSRE